MGIFAQVEMFKRPGYVMLNISGDDLGRLIGRHGQTLNALQYIVNLVVHKDSNEEDRVIIDVGGYRKRREDNLKRLAQTTAERGREKEGKKLLNLMSPQERRLSIWPYKIIKKLLLIAKERIPYRRGYLPKNNTLG